MKKSTKIIIATSFALLLSVQSQAQKFMGIGTDKPNPRSVLELKVEDPANFQQGFMPPKLTTIQRTNIAFQTALGIALKGMTVYDTDINAFFVWNGTSWDQLSIAVPSNISATGINGITANATGLGITVDGANLVKTTTLGIGDINGDYVSGLTVVGLSNRTILNSPSAGDILSFNGTNFIYTPIPAAAAQSLTTLGLGGINIASSGLGFTIDGTNLLYTGTGFAGDLNGTYNSTTITGLQGKAFSGTAAAGDILSFNGTNFVFTPLPSSVATSIIGIGGVSVSGSNTLGFTIDGSNLLTTSSGFNGMVAGSFSDGLTVNGINNYTITGTPTTGNVLSFNGTNFIYATPSTSIETSIIGINGVSITGTNASGFTIDGSNLAQPTLVGIAGLSVVGSGLTKSISGAGMVVVQQTLGNPIGSAYQGVLGTNTPIFKMPVAIPAGVKTLSISLNAYLLTNGGIADFRIQIDNTSPVNVDILNILSDVTDNITTAVVSPDISSKAGNTVMIKVFATNDAAAEAVYLQGITITVKD